MTRTPKKKVHTATEQLMLDLKVVKRFLVEKLKLPELLARYWRLVILVISICIISLNLLRLHYTFPYHSDGVELQNNVHWLEQGIHERTFLGTDNFLLKAPVYSALDHLSLSPRRTLFVTLTLFVSLSFLCFYLAGRYLLHQLRWFDEKYFALGFLFLISNSGVYEVMRNLNVRNIELGIAFLLLVPLVAIERKKLNKKLLLLLIPILSLFLFNDPYFLFAFFVPLVILLILSLFFVKQKSMRIALVLGLFVSILAVKAWRELALYFGIDSPLQSVHIVGLSELGGNLREWLKGLLRINNARFYLQPITPKNGFLFGNFVLVGSLMGYAAYYLLRNLRQALQDPWKCFVLAMPLFISAIFIVQPPEAVIEFRWLVPGCFGITFVLATLMQDSNARARYLITCCVILLVLANVFSVGKEVAAGDIAPNAINYQTINEVRARGYSKGYTDYWNAHINTYLSDKQITFLQLYCDDATHRLRPMYWLVDSGAYKHKAEKSFYLYEQGAFYTQGCNPSEVAGQLGEPTQIVRLNHKYVLALYDYDIYDNFDQKYQAR